MLISYYIILYKKWFVVRDISQKIILPTNKSWFTEAYTDYIL